MLHLKREKRSPYWYVRGKVGGASVYESTGTADKKLAEEYRLKRERDLYEHAVLGKAEPASWARAVNAYLDNGGEDRFLLPLVKRWGDMPLSLITQEVVDAAARDLYRTPATRVRQCYSPVRAVLNHARDIGLEGVSARRIKLPKVTKKPAEYATDDYLERLLEHCDPELRAVLLVMTYTGLRTGEVLRTTPEDWQVNRGWVRIDRTKNGQPAMVPLADEALEAVEAVGYRWRWKGSPELAKALRKAAERAGLLYMKAHSVGRHSFAARLLRQGHSLQLVARAGRWKGIAVVAANYGHLEQDHVHKTMREAAKR
jgi:integrase